MNNTTTRPKTDDARDVWIEEVKKATALRAELFERGNWTREEMDKANLRIEQSMANLRAVSK